MAIPTERADPPEGCEACEALRIHGPSIFDYLTLGDTPLCGFHASELHALLARKVAEVAEFREKLNAVIEFFWPTAQDDHVKQDILERALCALRASSERKP